MHYTVAGSLQAWVWVNVCGVQVDSTGAPGTFTLALDPQVSAMQRHPSCHFLPVGGCLVLSPSPGPEADFAEG